MASNGGQIRFGVGFDVDQSSLSKIKSSLREIQNLTTKDIQLIDASKTEQDLKEIKKSASELQTVLQKSFNSDLGTLNVTKFNEALKKMDLDLNKIQRDFASAGAVGQKAFKDLTTQVLTTNMQLTHSKTIIDQMGTTMMNTIKWGVASSVMNSFTGSVQEAFGFVKSLDTSLTNIRIVTGQSRDEMAQFAVEANNAAAALGRQTKEYTQAALTFYQQGLNEQEVKSRTETTLKASNITGQNSAQMADELTAVWNGFQVQVGQEADVVSKLAAVADSSASNMSELATAMSKVAAVANSMGVDVDQLAAQISTIVSVTRSAPESVGNALKTIYARIADIKAGIDEEETSLGNYSSKIAALGFNILDANGELKDMGEFLEEVGEGWQNLSREQQVYLARTMAGQRQYNNLVTLFDNWDKYIKNVNVSLNSQGTLEEKNSRYMESLAAHMKEFESAKEGLMISATDTESFKNLVDIFTDLTKGLTSFVDALGGGGNALMSFGAIATTVFSKQIGGAIGDLIVNFQNVQNDFATIAARKDFNANFQGNSDVYIRELAELNGRALNVAHLLTDEQQKQLDQLIQQTNELQNQEIDWKEKVKLATEYYNEVSKSSNENAQNLNANNLIKLDKDSQDYKDIVANLDAVKLHIEETNGDLQKYKTSILDAQKAVNRMIKTQQTASTESKEYTIATQNAQKALGSLEVTTENVIATSKQLYEEKLLEEEQYNELSSAYLSFRELVDTEAPEEKQIEAANRFFDLFKRRIEEAKNQVHEVGETLTAEVEGASEKFRNKTVDFKGSIIQALKPAEIQNMTTQVVKLAGGIGSVSMACVNLARIPKIWDDENLTKAEKLTQIIQTISFNLPMFATGMAQIGGAIKSLGSTIALTGTAMTAEAAATAHLTAETIGLGTALEFILGTLGPIVAILGVLGVTIYGVYQYMTRFERAVDEANESLKNQQKILQELRSQQKELTQGIQEYEDLSEQIKDVTKTTEEWRDINIQLSQSVSDLIAKFPKLSQYLTTLEGHIGFTKEGLETVTKSLQDMESSAIIGELASQIDVIKAQQQLATQDTIESIGIIKEGLPNYNINSGIYTPNVKNLDTEKLQEILNKLKNTDEEVYKSTDKLKETLIKSGVVSAEVAEQLAQHGQDLYNLQVATKTNSDAINNLNSAITNTYLLQHDQLQGDENAVARELVSQIIGQDANTYLDKYNIDSSQRLKPFAEREEYDFNKIAEDFANGQEYELERSSMLAKLFLGSMDTLTNTYVVINGVRHRMDNVVKELQKNSATINAVNNVLSGTGSELIQTLNASGLDSNVAAQMLHGLQEGGTLDLSAYTKEEQRQFVQSLNKYSENELKAFGLKLDENESAVEKAREAQRQDYSKRQNIINNSLDQNEKDILNNFSVETTTTKQVGEIQKNIQQLNKDIPNVSNNFETIWKGFNFEGQKAVDVSDVLVNDINNLGSEGSFEKLSNDLKANGLSVNFMNKEWQNLIQQSGAYDEFLGHLSDKVSGLNNIITETASGKKMSKSEFKQFNEDLQDTLNLLGDVSKLTPQLQQDIITIQDSFLQGTSQWNDALKRFREEAEMATTSLRFKDMEDAFKNVTKEIKYFGDKSYTSVKIDIDADDFQEKMQKLLDADYSLEVSVNADIESDLKDMGDMRDQISQLDALTGKTTVAFDAIKGIYSDLIAESENAVTILEDGSVQVSDTAIAEAKRRKEEELAAARETTQGEIEEQIKRIQSKIAIYEAELKAENEYLQALNEQKATIESGDQKEQKLAAQKASAKKKAYEEEVTNASNKVKAIDEAAGKEAEAVNNSSESQVTAMQGLVDASQQVVNAQAAEAEKVSQSVANEAKSVIANYDAMAAAKANYMSDNPSTKSGAVAVGAATGSRGSIGTVADLKKLDYQSIGESKIEVDFSDSAAKALQNVENQISEVTDKRNQTQNQLDRLNGALEAANGQLADLKSGNYANNAGERPKAEKAGKGGGKGKSAKEKTEKEPDKMDPFEDSDLDGIAGKFRDIDAEIQKLTRDLEKLQKLQSRYLGSALVHNLNEQLKIAKKQKAAYGEKLKIAKEELESQKAKLQAQGIEIGKNGTIKNYTETLKQKQKEINDLVDKHNAATKEGQKDLKEQVETQKKSYNELKNQMNAYEQLNGQTLPEIEAKIAEIEEMIINLQIEKFNARIELHLDWQSFLDEYRDFQSEMKEYFNSKATMFVDLETGDISGRNDNYENALAAGKAKAENARIARQQADAAEKAYNSEMKKSKKGKNRESLAEQYEIDTEGKSKKEIKKEIQKAIADAYEARNDAIKEQKEKADAEVEKLYKSGFNIITEDQAEAAEEYRKSIEEINKIALEERKVVDEEFSQYKKPSNDIIDAYNETLEEIEQARKESLDEAAAQYNEAMSDIADSSKVKIVDVFKTYTSKMEDLAKASDQMINGTILSNGKRGKSVIEENMEHALDLADRIDRMNKSTKLDNLGNKIMGTDDLKVGSTNPLTGERITNKKELKQVKKKIGKDKSGQVYADMQKKIYEDGKKYAQSLEEQIKTLQDQIQQAWENYYAAIDKVLDYTKQIIDDYEYIDSMYETQLKYLKLIGEEDSDRAKLIKQQQKANQDAQNEYYKQQIKEAKIGLQKAKENHGIESEEYKKYYEQLKSLSKDYYESRLKQIEDLRDEAIKANEDIIEKLNKDVTNQLGIQETSERWNDTKTEADSYLNSLEKVNALQSLRAKYQEAIDSTDDIKQQEELRRIMEEQLGALQQADYLSEKEVTNAENLLDVTKKQMALEEAKQNKSKMRLRRDSQGNYTYQFVADENNIKNKQQELQDSLKKMNDDTTKALRENYDEQVKLFDEFQQKLKEISEKYLSGESGWTEEQYRERINYTTDQFNKQYGIYKTQQDRMETNYQNSNVLSMVGAAANTGGLASDSDMEQFIADTGISAEEAQAIREILQSLSSADGEYSILKLLGNTNLKEIMDQMSQGSYDTISKIGGSNEFLGSIQGDLLNNHKETTNQVEETRNQLLNQTIEDKNNIDGQTSELVNEMMTDTDDTINTVQEHKDAITQLQDDGNSKLDDLYRQAEELENQNLEAIGGLQYTLDELLAKLQEMAEEEKNANMTKGDIVNLAKGSNLTNIYDKKGKDAGYINDDVNYKILGFKTVQGMNLVHIKNQNTGYSYWVERDDLKFADSFDTGGYTGDWSTNKDGKLAVLHEKELVLNQTDTSNLLDAVQITRSIANAISGLGLGAVSNLSAEVSSILGGLTGSSSTVDQNVTISANFPNVSSHTEIETALMNLVNVASQKASPNRRTY